MRSFYEKMWTTWPACCVWCGLVWTVLGPRVGVRHPRGYLPTFRTTSGQARADPMFFGMLFGPPENQCFEDKLVYVACMLRVVRPRLDRSRPARRRAAPSGLSPHVPRHQRSGMRGSNVLWNVIYLFVAHFFRWWLAWKDMLHMPCTTGRCAPVCTLLDSLRPIRPEGGKG